MKVVIIEINSDLPKTSKIIGVHGSSYDAEYAAKDYARAHSGVCLGVYEWRAGYSSTTEVKVEKEYCAPGMPPESGVPGVPGAPSE